MTIAQLPWLHALQTLVTNVLDVQALDGQLIAAILGDVPSTYAKSPRLWNAAFEAVGLRARYIPLDIPRERLRDAVALLRTSDGFLGGSVTVPYKQDIMGLLDEVDPLAARIGAVNVIVRTRDGRLVGHNTDGLGGVRALTSEVLPGQPPFCPQLTDVRILLLGAGGAAQALAVALWERMQDGELIIANRTRRHAESLMTRLSNVRAGHLQVIDEEAVAVHAPAADLLINATTKGQAGMRALSDGRWTSLEPYSSLGPVQPTGVSVSPQRHDACAEAWFQAARVDVQRNHEVSLQICARLPRHTRCYDLIYAPLETTFLRHARWSGHTTMNGQAMNIAQAVEACVHYVCRDALTQCGLDASQALHQVTHTMRRVWGT